MLAFQSLVAIAPFGSLSRVAAVVSLVESSSSCWWESQRNVNGLDRMIGSQPSVESVGFLTETNSGASQVCQLWVPGRGCSVGLWEVTKEWRWVRRNV